MDLKTGRVRRSADLGDSGNGRFGGLVLKRNGSIAWIWSRGRGPELSKLDAGGEAVLDGGPVDEGSLALAGSRLYWTRQGVPATALLR
jgi:hypothetical protein